MPIDTKNFISTPNITGNVSSCETKTAIINGTEWYNIFVQGDTGYFTNSCTGATQVVKSWDLTPLATDLIHGAQWLAGVVIFMVAAHLLIKWIKAK
jgi:hypothetical protein